MKWGHACSQGYGMHASIIEIMGPLPSTVAQASIPLPQPRLGFKPGDTYKIQLSINGEQVLTPWLPVLGFSTPPFVYLDIELVHSSGNLESARATVRTMAPEDATRLHVIKQQWLNATHWPKMLPVHYSWTAGPEVKGERALLFLFGSAVAMMAIVARNAWSAYREKLSSFVVDVTRAPQPKGD